jgi:tetratricopeptide (TPR) repeat protein
MAAKLEIASRELNKREWPAFLLSRGRTDEARETAAAFIGHPALAVQALGHVIAGKAELAAGRFAMAASESNAALAALKRVPQDAPLVLISLETLQGEFFLRTGQRERGHTVLLGVIEKLRAAPGPDEWTQTLFTLDAIARTAREVGEWQLAGQVAQQMLEHDSAYAGTHYALALVAEHQGDRQTADIEFALAEKAWDKADQDLPELAEVRKKLAFRAR